MKTAAEKKAFAGGVCVALSVVAAADGMQYGKSVSKTYEEIVTVAGPSWLLRWAKTNGDPELTRIRRAYRHILRDK